MFHGGMRRGSRNYEKGKGSYFNIAKKKHKGEWDIYKSKLKEYNMTEEQTEKPGRN